MDTRPNIELKVFLLKKSISQRRLSFGTEIDEALISKAIKYGLSTAGMREKICEYLCVTEKDIFPWD